MVECDRLLDDLAQAEVNREAGRRLLSPALVRLLPHLSRDGIRPTELARRVDVSKQAVGQWLRDLEAMAFVEMVGDPGDGRAPAGALDAGGPGGLLPRPRRAGVLRGGAGRSARAAP
ncbi:MAG TPA: helix-turn-helix domain-containing protein [Vicinamibacterales bacterium]|nr:helix-turn-helix domain-containing protein [Vicinamibacterales bacterium]